MKTCSVCRRDLPLGDFHKRSASRDGLQSKCKSCANEISRKQRTRRMSDPKFRERRRLSVVNWRRSNPIEAKLASYRKGARERGLPFLLTCDEFEGLVRQPCFYCLRPPGPLNGLDRLSNEMGYDKVNVVPCCTLCNRAKGTLNVSEFQEWAVRLGSRAKSLAKRGA